MMNMDGLKVKNFWLRYVDDSERLFDNFNFGVEAGQIVALMGASGCGKTSLFGAILCQRVPGMFEYDGKVLFNGECIETLRRSYGIGAVFQEPTLIPWRTALGNLRLPFDMSRDRRALWKSERIAEEGKKLLAAMDLMEFDKRPEDYSGGQRRRIEIVRSLISRPQLILMDEPFKGLDRAWKESVLPVIRDYIKEKGTTVLLTTHSPEESVLLADKIILLEKRDDETSIEHAKHIDISRDYEGFHHQDQRNQWINAFFDEVKKVIQESRHDRLG